MPVVKLTLSDAYYEKLSAMAKTKNKSIQDFIRDTIFEENTIFTPEEAVKRAHDGRFSDGHNFSLPDVYGDDWTIKRGIAGVFGKKFFNYVVDNDVDIEFVSMDKYERRAMYRLKEASRNG